MNGKKKESKLTTPAPVVNTRCLQSAVCHFWPMFLIHHLKITVLFDRLINYSTILKPEQTFPVSFETCVAIPVARRIVASANAVAWCRSDQSMPNSSE